MGIGGVKGERLDKIGKKKAVEDWRKSAKRCKKIAQNEGEVRRKMLKIGRFFVS
jgi:hypothetical protein